MLAAVLAQGSAKEPAPVIAYLWPCNVVTWQHWAAVQSQWRVGMGGITGLDYAGVRAYLDEMGVCGSERTDAFKGIVAAERATLKVHAEQAEQPA